MPASICEQCYEPQHMCRRLAQLMKCDRRIGKEYSVQCLPLLLLPVTEKVASSKGVRLRCQKGDPIEKDDGRRLTSIAWLACSGDASKCQQSFCVGVQASGVLVVGERGCHRRTSPSPPKSTRNNGRSCRGACLLRST
jgi:hypothetical protein